MWKADGTLRLFFVYIMSNTSMTLYTGVTNDLHRRASAHKNGTGSEFTARYHFDRCVYFETFESILGAIAREKQIKGWTRAKKIALIKTINPRWLDLTPPSP
jgi:putative endonuclease